MTSKDQFMSDRGHPYMTPDERAAAQKECDAQILARSCRKPATVEIHPHAGHFEDFTHACDAHIAGLLGHFDDQPEPHHYEVRLVTDEERARGWFCCHVDEEFEQNDNEPGAMNRGDGKF